jgi:hypothetical protein
MGIMPALGMAALMAGAAFTGGADMALAPEVMGADALDTADIVGSTLGGSQFAIDPAAAYTTADVGSSGLSALQQYQLAKTGLGLANQAMSGGQGGGGQGGGGDVNLPSTSTASSNTATSSVPTIANYTPGKDTDSGIVGLTGLSALSGAANAPTYQQDQALQSSLANNTSTTSNGIANLSPNQVAYNDPVNTNLPNEDELFLYKAAQGGLMAGGGIANLGSYSDGGQLLKGPGDGMSDNIPASIGAKQPARLADGEFVIPADVVSHLGNGSTDAGAKQLYAMMDKIRKARTGNKRQGKQINPSKFLPQG